MSEREKLSFSELDKQRREKKRGNGKKGPHSENGPRRSRFATAAYKRRVEEQLFGKKNDAGKSRLEQRLREAHDSPTFLRTYREYLKNFGMPHRLPMLMLLLDLDDEREVIKVIDALGNAVDAATVDEKNLLRSRMRNLEMSAASDALGDAASDLLGQL